MLSDLVGDKDKEEKIWATTRDVARFVFFNNSISLGISYGPESLSFTDMMLFNWIKEGVSGRKT